MGPSGFPKNLAGIYVQPWSNLPILDSICIEWDGADTLTITCFIGGEVFQVPFQTSDFTWTGGPSWVSNIVPFDAKNPDDGRIMLEVPEKKTPYLSVITRRTQGLIENDPPTIGPLHVMFKQTLATDATGGCFHPDETGVFINGKKEYLILCNGFIVSEGRIVSKVVDMSKNRISFEVGISDEWQLQLGTDTYLWEGNDTSTMDPNKGYKLLKSFTSMYPLSVAKLPKNYVGTWLATLGNTKGRSKFSVELGDDSFRVFSEDDGDVWHSHPPEYMGYDFLLNFDDRLVIGRGQYGMSFVLGLGGWNCISLFDEKGEHTSEVALKGFIPTPTPGPGPSTSGSPIILLVLALAAVWAMK
jgi:hypothetical protein